MQAIFRTFESGAGDCIFLILQDGTDGSCYHIMVDCNVLTAPIRAFIHNDLGNRIDTLIVTHIDSDHVNGITQMMRSPEFADLQIGQILFNGFQPQAEVPQQLSAEIKNKIEATAALLPPAIDENMQKTNGMVAACLIAELNNHPHWKAVWRKEPILRGTIIPLGEKWGQLSFLSPVQDALDALLREVKLEYAGLLGIAPPDGDFQDQDKYFELMLRLAALWKRPGRTKKTEGTLFCELLLSQASQKEADEAEVTLANKASLAFVWEGGTPLKRILFMGDAVSSVVVAGLNDVEEGEMQMEAIKVSHHASKHNTSLSLNSKVNSSHYFITGGKQNEGPHLETIAKIAVKPLSDGQTGRTIHINHTENIPLWVELRKEEALQILESHHLSLSEENVHEFEY